MQHPKVGRFPKTGSGKTLGARDERYPTYVYLSALKGVVRARFPHEVKDWVDPTGPQVPSIYVAAEGRSDRRPRSVDKGVSSGWRRQTRPVSCHVATHSAEPAWATRARCSSIAMPSHNTYFMVVCCTLDAIVSVQCS